MNTPELISKLKSFPQVLDCLAFLRKYSFIPVEKNFVEFSQDAYYAKFNTIVGVRKHYFLLPEVTEEWPVKKIIDLLERKLKDSSKDAQKVHYVSEETKDMLLGVAGIIREICVGKIFYSPLEVVAFVRELIDEEYL
jgi:hypothetical protein